MVTIILNKDNDEFEICEKVNCTS